MAVGRVARKRRQGNRDRSRRGNTAATRGPKLGAPLFQLPLNLKKDIALLDTFLKDVPPKARAAFECRHVSWFDQEVFDRLRARNIALCIADSEKLSTPVEVTADYSYFRLRNEGYTAEDIARLASTIRDRASACSDVFVYFKHEDAGKGPECGRMIIDLVGGAG